MFAKILPALVIVILSTSCTTRLGHFTVVSTKNIDWSRISDFQRAQDRIQGTDEVKILLVFPLKGKMTAHLDSAIDDALENIPGAVALIDVVVHQKIFFTYVFNVSGFVVEGKPVIDPQLASLPLKSNYICVKVNDAGQNTVMYLSKEEYTRILSDNI